MKSGNLNFLKPSGPLRACNGTALPLPFTTLFTLLHSYMFQPTKGLSSGGTDTFCERGQQNTGPKGSVRLQRSVLYVM